MSTSVTSSVPPAVAPDAPHPKARHHLRGTTTAMTTTHPHPTPPQTLFADSPGPLGDDAVRVDPACHVAEVNGRQLDLTYLEFELLTHLVRHPHQVHSRDRLMAAVWGYDHIGDGRTVDVHIARLRQKLGREHRHRIITVRRVGYKYVPTSSH
ncbi:winged helix-turn-helix domain-containing protein [Streptomyces broussonetiae]|uniref:winged helix-turn-helix domain-containing protein n=1 Tax=Streptomyces broussonetiae TaxID=2686304 RepID=UPI0035E238B0